MGSLGEGDELVSLSRQYMLVMQGDGNLGVYDLGSGQPIWSTGTGGQGSPPYEARLQVDSNFVMYGNGVAIWSTGTRSTGESSPHVLKLNMESDGVLVLRGVNDEAVWASH